MNVRDVCLRIHALLAPRRVERELDEELAFHIERETQKHLANGLSPGEARKLALACFGSVPLAADECRDARGVSLIGDLARDVSYAFRSFRRAPLGALTIVATVALGLGLVAAVFTVYNMIFLRTDAVRRPEELFAVERERPGEDSAFTFPEFEAMRRETNVFADAVAIQSVMTRVEGRRLTSVLVTGNFFHMLGVQAALGRALLPADDEASRGRPVIVLSHRAWNTLFAGDPSVIGRRMRINGRPYEIVGVMPEDFRGLAIIAPDYWAPLALANQFRDADTDADSRIPVEIIGRLRPGMSPQAATAGLDVWGSARMRADAPRERAITVPAHPASIKLKPRSGTFPAEMDGITVFSPIFFAFGLILMVGCANVANLLLARGVARQREIGIRLSLGASRRRIVRQLLTENLILALAAAACGLIVSRLVLSGAFYAVTRTVASELLVFDAELGRFVPPMDWRVLVFLLGGGIISTALFGLAPALQATRFELVRTMRGQVTRDVRPGRARQALLAFQVGTSALLLVCAAVFLRGALAAATADTGVRTSDTVRLSIANESRRAALLQALTADQSVAAVSASSLPTSAVVETSRSDATTPDTRAATSSRTPVELLAVSAEYFDLLGIDIVSGRGFTPAERTPEAGVVVVHETVARQLWPGRNAIGQVLRLDATASRLRRAPAMPSGAFTVVGVARDPGARHNASYLFRFRGVYVPTSAESAATWLFLRVHGDPQQASQSLLDRLTKIDPDLGTVTLRFMAGLQTSMLLIAFWVTVVLGGLALLLTVSGLFSVLSYLVEQQAKDIGVRMALGANTRKVVTLVLSQSLRPVGLGLAAGGGLAVALATALMATSAASEIGSFVRVFDPLAYAASVLIIVAASLLATTVPALRAAYLDPITTLRQD